MRRTYKLVVAFDYLIGDGVMRTHIEEYHRSEEEAMLRLEEYKNLPEVLFAYIEEASVEKIKVYDKRTETILC